MNSKEILNFCVEKGLLIDNEVLNLFKDTEDVETVKLIIGKIKEYTQKRIITKEIFYENESQVSNFLSDLSKEHKELKRLRIKLGLSIEILRQKAESSSLSFMPDASSEKLSMSDASSEKKEDLISSFSASDGINENQEEEINSLNNLSENNLLEKNEKTQVSDSEKFELKTKTGKVKILSMPTFPSKKIEVKDFVNYFRGRFIEMRNLLQEHSELGNLVSINKISGNRHGISVIGMIYSKKVTKNKNIMFEVEDLTGRIKVLVNQNKQDLYKKAEEITLDSVMGVRGSGSREIIFANNLISSDLFLLERKKSPVEETALFISDLHIGSKLFFEKNFLKFINYLNGEIPKTPEVDKIKYLFVVGDVVAGVGVYPKQDTELEIKDIEKQYAKAAELFGKIRKDIQIIMLPGNHDCVRLMEPQPILDEKYAWPLHNLKNVTLTTNPSLVNIGGSDNFSGFNILSYHGFSFPYYANSISSLMTQHSLDSPDKIMIYLLKNRHLAPTHTSVQYAPYEKDPLMIREAPDIFVSGHTHKGGISYYNNILVISSSCWEALTPFQEKMGNKPDFCKVPVFNLKTRQVKILDFYDEDK